MLFKAWCVACLGAFVYCAYVDSRTRKIPNRVTYPFLLATLMLTLAVGLWPAALYGGLLAGGVLLVPRLVGGRSAGGMGDVKLGALGGLLVGPQLSIPALLLAFVSASLLLLPLIIAKRVSWRQPVPFGPFLSLGFGFFLVLFIFAG